MTEYEEKHIEVLKKIHYVLGSVYGVLMMALGISTIIGIFFILEYINNS